MNTGVFTRICLFMGAVLVTLSAFFPWWNLELVAPQYPEGLNITVFPSKLVGEIDIINILNHYIGMADITTEGFPELKYIPYILYGIAVLLLISAFTLSRKMIVGTLIVILLSGGIGVYDMYHWLSVFGTELDPMAPIKIPPFIPPIIGENQLANFITYSSFKTGFYILSLGCLFVFAGVWKLFFAKRIS